MKIKKTAIAFALLAIQALVRASVWGPAALFHNPAGLMRVPVIVVEGAYSYLDGQDGHSATAAIVDSRTNEYAALGVAYSFISTAPDGRDRDGNQLRTALATGYRSGDFALYVGIGLRWLELTLGEEDPVGGESDDVDTWTLDTGLLFDFANRIRFAIVGQNLIDTETDEARRVLGFGFSFVFETLDVGANLDLDVSGRDGGSRVMRWGFGADWGLADQIHLRTGLTRPFLHLAMHLSISEQCSIDQPAGIRAAVEALASRLDSLHEAHHQTMECLGEMIWSSQRSGAPPDGAAYLDCVRRRDST